MSKILVLGNSGSGKSTFTAMLSEKLNIEHLYLDPIVYKTDWEKPDFNHMEEVVDEFVNKEKWIIDGNFLYNGLKRFDNCDTIYFLDINRFTCLISVIYRYFKYKGKHRESKSDLCEEKITRKFLKWVFIEYYQTSRKIIYSKVLKYDEKNIIIFKSRRQVKKYFKEMK